MVTVDCSAAKLVLVAATKKEADKAQLSVLVKLFELKNGRNKLLKMISKSTKNRLSAALQLTNFCVYGSSNEGILHR